MMDLIKSTLILLFKMFVVVLVVLTIFIVIVAFMLKKDVDEIKEFTDTLKREGLDGFRSK